MTLPYSDEYLDELRKDFRKFLYVIWDFLNLPKPTLVQYDIANYLQKQENTKIAIQAFRGVGKSFITSAYVLWELFRDPQKKIFVVSASKQRADAFTTFTLRLIEEIDFLMFLKPKANQRSSRIEFDVGPATPDQSPSVRSVGITGQLTGSRADIIVADDVEVLNNSATADMREKLSERIKEFSAILKPLPYSKTVFLGTPQTEDSIYNKLPETFHTRIWPAEIPTEQEISKYGEKRLAPLVRRMATLHPSGTPTDPDRFDEFDLAARKAEYGKAGYALQFMLNTQLSDTERYPLKVKDLIVMDTRVDKAPMNVEWLPDYKREVKKAPNLAMSGDRFFWYAGHSEEFMPYDGTVMAIDPSGRGKDETGYAIIKMLNGFLYIRKAGGLLGGYDSTTLTKLAELAKEEEVNYVVIESNFGDGMFTQMIKPVFSKIHPCTIEEVRHSTQKERRIIDTLEPVMARHKLVIDLQVIEDDYRTAQQYDDAGKYHKTLIYQLTRISYERGSLKHDDRLDALSMAIAYWTERISVDAVDGIKAERERLLKQELEQFMKHAIGANSRHNNNNKKWSNTTGSARKY